MHFDTLVVNGRVVGPRHGPQPADLGIAGKRIAAVLDPYSRGSHTAARTIDAGGKVVLPGVIDPHTHFGLAAGLADWETESRSAAAGGVTTVLNFLMSGEPYDAEYRATREAADRSSHVDYGLHLCPSTPTHLAEMPRYMAEYGITSYKYFTSFRGTEGHYLGIQGTDDSFLYRYLRLVAQHDGAMACIHTENIEVVWHLRQELQAAGRDDLAAWDESRPDWVEADCVHRGILFARQAGAPLYIVHMSAALCLDEVRSARRRWPGVRVYVETCPHFLTHTSESPLVPHTLGKINPPLRHAADVEALWAGLADGTVDTVGSDHAARRKAKKTGTIWSSAAGFPGTGAILPVLLSEGYHRRGLPLERIVELTSSNPARLFGLAPRKGSLAVGADADLVIVDLDAERVCDGDTFQSHADYSLYDGWTLKGWPVLTMLRGRVIMENGRVVTPPGSGRYLSRTVRPRAAAAPVPAAAPAGAR
jgi:dihydropyrimidinase